MFNGFFKRAPKQSSAPRQVWFDPKKLDATFNELQAAVKETTNLASTISSQLESRLHVTEQTLTTVMCVITEGIIITDKDLIIRDWNTGAEIIFGYTTAEAIGQHIDILVSPDAACKKDIRSRFNHSEYSSKGNVNRIRTLECCNKAGEAVLVEISVNAFPDGLDDCKLIAIVRDITTQHQEQQALDRQRQLLETVIDAVTDVVIVRDGKGRWVLLNRAGYSLYGFKAETDFVGKTNVELAEEIPFFKDHLLFSAESDAEAWTSRRTVRFETEVTDSQNQKQYFDVLKTPVFGLDKQPETLVVIARNITRLKEKREHVLVAHKALNASSDIVCITDDAGKILFVNKMFLIKYRFIDIRDVIGERMSIVKSSKTTKALHQELWATIKAGKTWEGTVVNQDTTGKELTVKATIMPIIDQNLAATYFICIQKCID